MSNLLLCRHHPALIGDTLDYSLYENQYMTTEALESGNISFTIPAAITTTYITSISYRKNGGLWTTTANSSSAITITVPVVSGDIIEWKGIIPRSVTNGGGSPSYAKFVAGEALFNLYGNLMSLFWGDEFIGKTEFPWQANNINTLGARNLFQETNVVDASNFILPALELYWANSSDCHTYAQMFQGCVSLIYPPAVLPATILGGYVYYCMFKGCTSMTTMPDMENIQDTTTTARGTFMGMFEDCSALQYNTQQTIHINRGVYQGCSSMFKGCTSIVNAPNIEIYELGNPISGNGTAMIFDKMFYGCSSLETPPERIDLIEVDNATFYQMFVNCTNLEYTPIINIKGLHFVNSTMTPNPGRCSFDEMFYNCTNIIDASGINIYFPDDSEWSGEKSFYKMFYGCRYIEQGPSIHTNGNIIVNANFTFGQAFYNCNSMESHDIELNYTIDSSATVTTDSGDNYYGNYQMFYNCDSMLTTPRITRPSLRIYELRKAFDNCSALRDVYIKSNEDSAGNAFTDWLANCGTLSGVSRTVHLDSKRITLPGKSTSGVPTGWNLDQGSWTPSRVLRMTMSFGWYSGTLNDSIINNIISNPSNYDVPTFNYYGDTIEIDDTLYYVWENSNGTNSDYGRVLTTTDNFYELKQASLYWGGWNLSLTHLGKTYEWLEGMLSSIDVITYDREDFETAQVCGANWYMFNIWRNQG